MADGVDSLMYDLGAGKSAIREVFEQTMELKQQGVTDFWDYSIGNPNVPVAPQVTEASPSTCTDTRPTTATSPRGRPWQQTSTAGLTRTPAPARSP